MCNSDNAAYLACLLDAAISATAPAEAVEAEMYGSASVVVTVNIPREGQTFLLSGHILCFHGLNFNYATGANIFNCTSKKFDPYLPIHCTTFVVLC